MRRWSVLFMVMALITYNGCTKKDELNTDPGYEVLRKFVKKNQDHKAEFTFQQYETIIRELSKNKYRVLPINEFRKYQNDSLVVVGLRHDVDRHPFKALKMARLESKYNINASYYILATDPYYGKITKDGVIRYPAMEQIYQDIYSLGHEIGIHNDLLTVMIKYGLDPYKFNQEELKYYESIYIPIYGTVAHGSKIARQTVGNYWIFSDFAKGDFIEYNGEKYRVGRYSLEECGYQYEANFIDFNEFYHDVDGQWNIDDEKGKIDQLLEILRNSEKGDRIQLLVHPVWWGDDLE